MTERTKSSAVKWLPAAEMNDVMESDNRGERIVGSAVIYATKQVAVWFGDQVMVLIPFHWFTPSHNARPDFDDVRPIDSGHGLKVGDFEASADAIRQEFKRA